MGKKRMQKKQKTKTVKPSERLMKILEIKGESMAMLPISPIFPNQTLELSPEDIRKLQIEEEKTKKYRLLGRRE